MSKIRNKYYISKYSFVYFLFDLILDSSEPMPSSKVLNSGMLNLVQTISTFPFLQNPSGQTTIILPLDANKPNSSKEIGDFVSG